MVITVFLKYISILTKKYKIMSSVGSISKELDLGILMSISSEGTVMEKMEALEWKKRIHDLALKAGFSAVGFTSAKPIEGLKEFLEERNAQGWNSSFEEKDLLKRVDPKNLWSACETIVALAYPLPFSRKPQEGEGVLARSAVGEDYHTQVKMALAKLVSSLEEEGWPGERPRTQVDTGPLNERAFATRAGLGWIGKNQQLIIPGVGSFVALAVLLLDQALPPDEPLQNQCGECTLCIQACPAQILGPMHFQANQCLSYLTQSKEVLTESQQIALENRIFGCDTCQEACPHNRVWLSKEEELGSIEENLGESNSESYPGDETTGELAGEFPEQNLLGCRGVDLWDTLHLTKSSFNKQWKSTAAGWRGKGILQRNAYLALKNLQDSRLKGWEEERKNEELPTLIQRYMSTKG